MSIAISRIFTLSVVLGASTSTWAEPVKRNMPACTSEEYLDELQTYSAKGDNDGIKQLFVAGSCTMLRAGDSISVISPGFMVATVRHKGQKLFTPSEALR
jgi:hypothetical protein